MNDRNFIGHIFWSQANRINNKQFKRLLSIIMDWMFVFLFQ